MTLRAATTNPSTGAVPRSSNPEVIDTIRAHHSELAAQLHERTWNVLVAAEHGDCARPRATLYDWYRATLLPHVASEEQALYSAASELDATRLLVCAMLSEHRTLVSLITDLAEVRDPFETALIAASAQVLFTAHLSKENDLLLPALDAAGLDLGAALDGMHEILGHADGSGGSGCGCGYDHGTESAHATPVQIVPAPAQFPPAADAEAPLTSTVGDLDVRALPHGQRHEIIFERLDALEPGEALVLANDHDPKPLRYQTEALWPGRFAWTYLQAGPALWRLAIRRAD